MIGEFDEGTLHAELTLEKLDPVAVAYANMTSHQVRPQQFANKFGRDKAIVQVFYPGPVIRYERLNGIYKVEIFHNGGNKKQTEELNRRILDYVERNGA